MKDLRSQAQPPSYNLFPSSPQKDLRRKTLTSSRDLPPLPSHAALQLAIRSNTTELFSAWHYPSRIDNSHEQEDPFCQAATPVMKVTDELLGQSQRALSDNETSY
jgi:hypothetical protein